MSVRSKPNREVEAPAEPDQDRGELPEGWAWARMLDVLDYEGGSQPPKKDFVYEQKEGYVRLLQIRDFGEKPFPTFVPKSSRLKTATADDLLLARYGGSSGSDSLGRVCSGLEGAYNVALAKLIFDRTHLDPEFVRALFLGPWFRAKVSQNSRSCQTGFNRDDVEDIWFPIAPLSEQRRIVGKLELLLGKVSSSQQRLSRVPGLLKRFRQSVLAAACSGKLTADWREENSTEVASIPAESGKRPLPPIADDEQLFEAPPTWQWCRLGTLAAFINGDRGKNYPNKNEYVPEGMAFINTGHIRPDGSLSSETMHFLTRAKFDSLGSGKIKRGDLVYCLRGATLGKTAFVEPYEEGAIASSLVIIRLNAFADRKFAYYVLTSPYGKELVGRFDNGSAQPNLSADSVKNYTFPLPPLPEQQEIVRRVEKLFAFADQIESRLRQAKSHVDRLTQSLLAKAFRGELVPTDYTLATAEGREYEPASELLARIQAEQNSTAATVKPKRKRVQQSRGSHS